MLIPRRKPTVIREIFGRRSIRDQKPFREPGVTGERRTNRARRSDSDRRSGTDRREVSGGKLVEELITIPDRRSWIDRRSGHDRRDFMSL
jgi:hypothetical protein